MRVFTIGFTEKSAERFFGLIKGESILKRVIDVRLHNTSQLAGFAKSKDLRFFLKEICGVDYVYVPELAPTKALLDAYRKHHLSWQVYEQEYLNLLSRRNVEKVISQDVVAQGCLLCSEHLPHHCHRRLALEYLENAWGCSLDTTHLY